MRRGLTAMLVTIALAGCASMQPTPAQQRVYQQVEECSTATGHPVNIAWVSPDGRQVRFGEGRADGLSKWQQRMTGRYWLAVVRRALHVARSEGRSKELQ